MYSKFLGLLLLLGFSQFSLNGQTKISESNEFNYQPFYQTADSLFQIARYDAATFYINQAVESAKTKKGEKSEEYFDCLRLKVKNLTALKQYEESVNLSEFVLKNVKKSLGENHILYANHLDALSGTYLQLRQFDKAKNHAEQALKIAELHYPKESVEYTGYLNRVSEVYYHAGEYLEAEKLMTEALELTKKTPTFDSLSYMKVRKKLMVVKMYLQKFEESETAFLDILAFEKRILGDRHSDYLITLGNLSSLYTYSGKYAMALASMKEVVRGAEEIYGKNNSKYFSNLVNLAACYQDMRQLEKTKELYLEAAELMRNNIGTQNKEYARLKSRMSTVYYKLGDIEKSVDEGEESVKIYDSVNATGEISFSNVLAQIALNYFELGKYQAAEEPIRKSLGIIEEAVGKDHPMYSIRMGYLGVLYQKMGERRKATDLFLASKRKFDRFYSPFHRSSIHVIKQLGEEYLAIGKLDSASIYLIDLTDRLGKMLHQYYPYLSEDGKISMLTEMRYNIHYVRSFGVELPDFADELQTLNLAIKGLALEKTVDKSLEKSIAESNDEDLKETYQKWKAVRTSIANFSKNSSGSVDSLVQIADAYEEDFRAAFAFQNHENFGQRNAFTYTDLQKSLGENEAAVDIVYFDYHSPIYHWQDTIFYYALVTRPQWDVPKYIQIGTESELQKLLSSSVSLQNNTNYITDRKKNHEFYKLIWEPLAIHLKGVENVHISPDGLLHQVAFEALKTHPDKNKILLDLHNIFYHGNLRDFISGRMNEKTDTPPNEIALFGGAYYNMDSTALKTLVLAQSQDEEIAFLPEGNFNKNMISLRSVASDSTRNALQFNFLAGTKKEVENIYTQFSKKGKKGQLFTGEKALEDQVKSLSGTASPDILHLATHGYFFKAFEQKETSDNTLRGRIVSAENPLLRSGVVFTGVNHAWLGGMPIEGLDDGVLTAYEISNLDLSNTKLAVLSACETGRGDIHDAEGVFGLQRAFKMAGVDQLIISLWKVPDLATSEMMSLFYKHYLKGKTVNEAFRKARKKMRKKYDPYYWAAFVLTE